MTQAKQTKALETQGSQLASIVEGDAEESSDDEEVKKLEVEVEKALDQAAQEEEKKAEDVETDVTMELQDMIPKFNSSKCKEYEAICHSFFIAKDNTEINWRRPYVQQSSVHC